MRTYLGNAPYNILKNYIFVQLLLYIYIYEQDIFLCLAKCKLNFHLSVNIWIFVEKYNVPFVFIYLFFYLDGLFALNFSLIYFYHIYSVMKWDMMFMCDIMFVCVIIASLAQASPLKFSEMLILHIQLAPEFGLYISSSSCLPLWPVFRGLIASLPYFLLALPSCSLLLSTSSITWL